MRRYKKETQMNVNIEKSELVEIEGLTEASVASPDSLLIGIVNYADLAASYLPAEIQDDDDSMHPVHQLREACMHELARRHGSDYMLPNASGVMQSRLRVAA